MRPAALEAPLGLDDRLGRLERRPELLEQSRGHDDSFPAVPGSRIRACTENIAGKSQAAGDVYCLHVRIRTIGHGTRPLEELVRMLTAAGVETLVDVRRFPGSRRNPQFGRETLAAAVEEAGIAYRHAQELGGRRSGEPGEERFGCIRVAAFRSYAARMAQPEWRATLEEELARPAPAFLCAETLWTRCHRRLIAELLHARGHRVEHLLTPARTEPHVPWPWAEARGGVLHLCGEPVA
jgi:hypothetical protein